MKNFNWEEFKDRSNRIAVRCRTVKEAKDFLREMHNHGLRWCSGESYLENTEWGNYKETTAYSNFGEYCDFTFYQKRDYVILDWNDYMNNDRIETVEEFLHRTNKNVEYI